MWAVFVSGNGSNLQALIEDKVAISLVVTSKETAKAVERAQEAGLKVWSQQSSENKWSDTLAQLKEHNVRGILLAGFMRVIPESFLKEWQRPIINLHPSLLPAYPGLKSIERAYKDGADIGVTLHHVVPEVDAGEVILQEVALQAGSYKGMSLEEVEAKVHRLEHRMICQVAKKLDEFSMDSNGIRD